MREPIVEPGSGTESASRTQPSARELSAAKQKLFELLAKDREQRARPIEARTVEEPSALSFGQRRLWFLDRWSPGSTTYNEFVRLHLEGRLDVEALRESLATVVQRHAVLRTVFRETRRRHRSGRRPEPPARAGAARPLDAARERAGERVRRPAAATSSTTPFNLAVGPLVRARLVRLGASEHELLLSVHHIACDGWSLGIFVRELGAAYAAIVNGEAPALPPLDIQYADYARWQREAAETPSAMAQLEYWKRQLPEPAPVLDLPFARPRPDARTPAGITEFFSLDADLAAKVQRLARAENATPFMVLLAAFHALLHRYTGETDIRVGTPVAGRTRVETEPLIGFFVNTLVMRGDLSGEPSFRELLQRVRATGLAAYANQEVPFEHLVETLRTRRDLSHTPLFQALFVLQNAPLGEFTLPGLRITPIEVDRGTSKFDLALSLTETAEGFNGQLRVQRGSLRRRERRADGRPLHRAAVQRRRHARRARLDTAAPLAGRAARPSGCARADPAPSTATSRCIGPSRARLPHGPTRSRSAAAPISSLTRSSIAARTSWRTSFARAASGRTFSSASTWSDRSTWSSGFSGSSRRAAPTSPSTRCTPPIDSHS